MPDHRAPARPTVSRSVAAPAEAVWAVLADGWQYATWVVGASRVRAVDAGWPRAGTRCTTARPVAGGRLGRHRVERGGGAAPPGADGQGLAGG